MRRWTSSASFIAAILALLAPSFALAAGTLPIALTQQFSFTNCQTFTNACGTPLQGGLLYFYETGTVATPQQSFADTGLTIPNPWPLSLDANGRIPPFYLADGSVHVRLTDSAGVVQFDFPSMLVIGPSSGGGGGGGSVDPTAVASTGDIKFRPTAETVSGWVKLNGQTIGSATSGATGRANADTQALYVYLWGNCPDAHCPVSSGRGASGLADFNANKTLTLPDLRGRGVVGLDDMGNSPAGRILASNVTSGGGDGVTTPNATGGEANHVLSVAELASHTHAATISDPGHSHGVNDPGHAHGTPAYVTGLAGIGPVQGAPSLGFSLGSGTFAAATGISIRASGTGISLVDGLGHMNITQPQGGNAAHNTMGPFMLGSWYEKL